MSSSQHCLEREAGERVVEHRVDARLVVRVRRGDESPARVVEHPGLRGRRRR